MAESDQRISFHNRLSGPRRAVQSSDTLKPGSLVQDGFIVSVEYTLTRDDGKVIDTGIVTRMVLEMARPDRENARHVESSALSYCKR